jgi:hypothetical protein
MLMFSELSEDSGLIEGVNAALADTYKGPWMHAPGQVFADLATALVFGEQCVSGIRALGDRQHLVGPVASMPTTWRVLEKIDPVRLPRVYQALAAARERAWAAGAAPKAGEPLRVNFDATIVIAHSDKAGAAPTWKKTFGFHPLFAELDRPEIAGGEPLAGLLRDGNAGSNTAADHIAVLDAAIASLPPDWRPSPDDASPKMIARSDAAGATHEFTRACRERGVGFSVGFDVDERVQAAVDAAGDGQWVPAVMGDGTERERAFVAEITDAVDISAWCEDSRLFARVEPFHPGAQMSLHNTSAEGERITCFLADDTRDDIAAIELDHRLGARVEDRIRQGKATGLRNLPCYGFALNAAWLAVVHAAAVMICWNKLLAFKNMPSLAYTEIAAFRRRVFGAAARVVRTGRRHHLRFDRCWRWSTDIAAGFDRQRAAFAGA